MRNFLLTFIYLFTIVLSSCDEELKEESTEDISQISSTSNTTKDESSSTDQEKENKRELTACTNSIFCKGDPDSRNSTKEKEEEKEEKEKPEQKEETKEVKIEKPEQKEETKEVKIEKPKQEEPKQEEKQEEAEKNNRGIIERTIDGDYSRWKPASGWKDSYQANGFCWCNTTYDHNLDEIDKVSYVINGKKRNIRDICEELTNHPDYVAYSNGMPPYNDIQCGNGPANTASDERGCPGRTDMGQEGCGIIGPNWDIDWLESREIFQ